MLDRFHALLTREPFAILDAGLATELEHEGCELDDPLWSAKILVAAPERLRAVHRRFAEAGADIVTSASYQATIPGFVARGLDEARARALIRGSVECARAATAADTLIAASIGSYGAYLADGSEYRGGYGLDRAALVDFHRERLVELLAAGPDLLAFETMPDAVELEAIAELLASLPDSSEAPPAWVSVSLAHGQAPEELAIADGTPLLRALAPLLAHPRVAALGINCVGPREVLPALEALARARPGLPLVAYPNSGERWQDRAWAGDRTPLEQFAALAQTWVAAGARLVGGCCRTRPSHIRALARLREQLSARLRVSPSQ